MTLIGQPVVVFIKEIRDDAGVIADPVDLVLQIQPPTGALQTIALADLDHVTTGHYQYAIDTSAGPVGTWTWRFESTSPESAGEGDFVVSASQLSDPQPLDTEGLCTGWTTTEEIAACGGIADDDDERVDLIIQAASRACFLLGGSRWPGVCGDVVRLTSCGCWRGEDLGTGTRRRYVNPSGLPCGGSRSLRLPGEPVVSVESVTVLGDALDPTDFVILDDQSIVRVDGSNWPCCGCPTDDPPPIVVEYTYGAVPPALGRLAASALARELLKSCNGDDDCALDRRVTGIVREGISEDLGALIPGLVDALGGGFTGLPELDLFVHAENPHRLMRRGRLVVPGSEPSVHRVR